MDLENLPFRQRMQIQEFNIRGMYLSVSCDIEFVLISIAAKCLIEDPVEREKYKLKKMGQISMGSRIGTTEKALKAYNMSYYQQFESCFKCFKELLEYRNVFGHSRITYDPKEKDRTWIVSEYINSGKRVKEKIVIKDKAKKLDDYSKEVVKLMRLVEILSQERGVEPEELSLK